MIAILESTSEVDVVCRELTQRKLFLHRTPQKNWDHFQLLRLLQEVPKDARILDLGSGGGDTLRLLHQSGYTNLRGIDLERPRTKLKQRLRKLVAPGTFAPGSIIERGNICDTGLPAAAFDVLTCVSVLEHGVDVAGFLREAERLLVEDGLLFATVDYWESFDPEAHEVRAVCGLPWNIFDRRAAEELVRNARELGLEPVGSSAIPPCREKPVHYAGRDYTFLAVALRKTAGDTARAS